MPEEEIRRHPDRTVIPGFVVDALATSRGAPIRTSATASTTPSRRTSASTWRASRPTARAAWSATSSATCTGRPPTPTISRSSPRACASGARRAAESWPRERDPRGRHRERAAGGDGRARARRQSDRLHRRRRPDDGLRARPAPARPAAHHGDRGRHRGPAVAAGMAPHLDQRDARGVPRADAARHHRHLPDRPAGLPRRGLHRRRPDRPVGQPQHERHRRLRAAQGAAARLGRRQRHHLAVPRGDHPHRAREAPLRPQGRLHHEPRPRGGRRLARAAAGSSSAG